MMAIPSLISAQSQELDDAPDSNIVLRTIYYGAESSDHPNNPCKGATIRKCAEIDYDVDDAGDGNSIVVKTVKDHKGIVKSVSRSIVAAPVSDIIQEAISKLPANADITHINR